MGFEDDPRMENDPYGDLHCCDGCGRTICLALARGSDTPDSVVNAGVAMNDETGLHYCWPCYDETNEEKRE